MLREPGTPSRVDAAAVAAAAAASAVAWVLLLGATAEAAAELLLRCRVDKVAKRCCQCSPVTGWPEGNRREVSGWRVCRGSYKRTTPSAQDSVGAA